ncbi:DUF2066 domain-containing protein [Pseudomonas sp. N040]|uniref:DUF2066 domain-containing protein n=1 Tax=Pseudomonas sp. N040 TaxID=2785325 RepID=UPI0018A337FC|nr:DUF2066 domain-containing protein [Pseudomonas sp. N040]MBF7729392.1 DUF2066 domain-containing protein [Pseudomonas sp. N040]MBW7013032.1 DUF2066 domain-containing protein [Pseudomonas sp. N040]
MRLITCLLVCALSALSLPALAAQTSGLYQVRTAVPGQQPEERTAALNRALDTLIVRLTGDPAILQSAAVAELHKDPQQLISQFGVEGSVLVVDFDPLTTESRLRQAGLPLWGANRPLLLVWWLNEVDGSSSLVGDGSEQALPVQAAAQNRGLPVSLPLADLQEQLAATPENLAAARADALLPVSQRYAADALLGVTTSAVEGKWQAQWRLWLEDGSEQGAAEAVDPAALADEVMLAVSLRLAPRFIIAPGAAQPLTLVVQGTDLARYAELERLLKPFAARLLQAQGANLTYQLNASPEQLRAQLALGQLREVSAIPAQPVAPLSPLSTDPQQVPGAPLVPVVPRPDVLTFSW